MLHLTSVAYTVAYSALSPSQQRHPIPYSDIHAYFGSAHNTIGRVSIYSERTRNLLVLKWQDGKEVANNQGGPNIDELALGQASRTSSILTLGGHPCVW
jgi:hypothetical protein